MAGFISYVKKLLNNWEEYSLKTMGQMGQWEDNGQELGQS